MACGRQDIVSRVYRAFGEDCSEPGQVSLEDVAAHLDIKARTLRTRLAEAGTNFNQLLADYRCNLAKRLLASTDESIGEIVYLTGFSGPSTFTAPLNAGRIKRPSNTNQQKRQQGRLRCWLKESLRLADAAKSTVQRFLWLFRPHPYTPQPEYGGEIPPKAQTRAVRGFG